MCGKEFKSKTHVKYHMKIHTAENIFKCTECPHSTKEKGNLRQHYKRMHEKTKEHKCHSCNKAFITKCEVKIHLRTHLGIKRYQRKCHICSKVFFNVGPAYLDRHVKIVHEGKKEFKCDLCSKFYTTKSHLKTHKLDVHGDDVRKYKCKFCHKQFKSAGNLRQHESTHENNVHKCDSCDKEFKSLPSLKNHFRNVHNRKPVSCDVCKKMFYHKVSLVLHIKNSHSDDNKEKSRCDICQKVFSISNPTYLKKHKLIMHGEKKLLKCDFCEERFLNWRDKYNHCNETHKEK